MKPLSVVFSLAVVGVVVCLGGTIYTVVQESRAQSHQAPHTIVVPAIPSHQ